jgi:hypothetical protein
MERSDFLVFAADLKLYGKKGNNGVDRQGCKNDIDNEAVSALSHIVSPSLVTVTM